MRLVVPIILSMTIVGAVRLIAVPTVQVTQTSQSQDKVLTEFQKETISSIREITLQLLLLAVGVFALAGGYAADKDKDFRYLPLGWIAFLLLGVSVVAGLLTYGNLIYTLGKSSFDPFSQIRTLAAIQWVSFGFGGLLFMFFVLFNMRRRS